MTIEAVLLVGTGGVLGALARRWTAGVLGGGPRGTLAVNVLGSFLLGVLVGVGVQGRASLVLATGFCGAFTTFSSFAVETVRLAEDEPRRAAVNGLTNLVAALAAVLAGGWLVGAVGLS